MIIWLFEKHIPVCFSKQYNIIGWRWFEYIKVSELMTIGSSDRTFRRWKKLHLTPVIFSNFEILKEATTNPTGPKTPKKMQFIGFPIGFSDWSNFRLNRCLSLPLFRMIVGFQLGFHIFKVSLLFAWFWSTWHLMTLFGSGNCY